MASHETSRRILVWDLPTRLFHWSLVALVATALFTGFVFPEWWMDVHAFAGYAIVALLAFRLVWGFYGPEFSRIANFAYNPGQVIEYLRGVLMLRPAHSVGHNPAGAMMIFALIIALTVLTISGLMVLGGEEKQGPFTFISYRTGNDSKTVHSVLAWALVAMVAIHVLGVIVDILLTRDNLIRAMITGYKDVPGEMHLPPHRDAQPRRAAIALAVVFALGGGLLGGLAMLPPSGIGTLVVNPTWKKECGDCHWAFHPSLLPAASWEKIMADLSDHFGEDATLDEDKAIEISQFLAANSGEFWSTEASARFRRVSPADPRRITASPYWERKHKDIKPAVFAQKNVGGKVACPACHTDATTTARFDDQTITIPKEPKP